MPQPILNWRGFLTHLCRRCESMELVLLQARLAGTAPQAIETVRNQTDAHTHDWPFVTCTCIDAWGRECDPVFDLCIRHRYQEACETHEDLLIVRQQNDDWLRKIGMVNGRLRMLDPAVATQRHKMERRVARGTPRACRCGMDIDEFQPVGNHVPRVFLCLGCEGVVHNVLRPNVPVFPANARNAWTRSAKFSYYRLRRMLAR